MAIALVFATLPVCRFFDKLNAFVRRREVARAGRLRALPARRWWQGLYLRYLDRHLSRRWGIYLACLLVFFVYGWMFVRGYAIYDAVHVKRGEVMQVAVRLVGANADLPASKAPTWGYLGAVSNYVFLYDPAARQPLILQWPARVRRWRPSRRPTGARLRQNPDCLYNSRFCRTDMALRNLASPPDSGSGGCPAPALSPRRHP